MAVLPPGTLLQLMYLKERLARIPPGRFIEIGPGSGEITRLLLACGWVGSSYDLEEKTTDALTQRFSHEISVGRLTVMHSDFTASAAVGQTADLVISCMVMEHLEEEAQVAYLKMAATCLKRGGHMIGLVPSSPAHWGIEDETAGHLRRYTRTSIQQLLTRQHWKLKHISGLTFPVSNILLPISNFLVNRSERTNLQISTLERTKLSGRRDVKYKTHFPSMIGLLLNEYTMLPLHIVQKFFSKSEKTLVLYFEAQPEFKSENL